MQLTIIATSPQEAGYAARMFDALSDAMLEDPPVKARELTTEEMSQAFADTGPDDTKAESVGPNDKPAGKRGRKSNAEKEALAAAAAIRPGDLLKGASAQTLQQALSGMPLVHSEAGLEVRVAPDTPVDEIAAMKARIDAESPMADAMVVKSVLASPAATAEDFLAGLTGSTGTVSTHTHSPAQPAAANPVDDLAALFKKKDPAPAPQVAATGASKYAAMTHAELMKTFMDEAAGNGGILWARRVIETWKVDSLDDMTKEAFLDALENPKKYDPKAA